MEQAQCRKEKWSASTDAMPFSKCSFWGGGEAGVFGGEASPPSPPIDETLIRCHALCIATGVGSATTNPETCRIVDWSFGYPTI